MGMSFKMYPVREDIFNHRFLAIKPKVRVMVLGFDGFAMNG